MLTEPKKGKSEINFPQKLETSKWNKIIAILVDSNNTFSQIKFYDTGKHIILCVSILYCNLSKIYSTGKSDIQVECVKI